ncbi:MAG: ADP-ribosylglycohydrolase family protein [Acidimicrobiales bacterium]
MLGACIGDAWGAPYEFKGPRTVPDGYERGVFGTEAAAPGGADRGVDDLPSPRSAIRSGPSL